MSPELFTKYEKNPLEMDEEVRRALKIPDTKYYSVSMMNNVGEVHIISGVNREVKSKKISKSDQKE